VKLPPAERLEYQLTESRDIPRFAKEHRFHPTRRWRFDFAWPALLVAVEVHGGVFVQGHHNRGKGFCDDREKAAEAQLLGWIILEVAEPHIRSHQALDWIRRALELRETEAGPPGAGADRGALPET